MADYELVLHRPGAEDAVVAMAYDGNLFDEEEFEYDGIQWVVVKDDGPAQVHVSCGVRLICTPKV